MKRIRNRSSNFANQGDLTILIHRYYFSTPIYQKDLIFPQAHLPIPSHLEGQVLITPASGRSASHFGTPIMHRFPSRAIINRFRFVAVMLCLGVSLTFISCGILIYSLIIVDREITLYAIILGAIAGLLTVVQWILAPRTRCPLCMTPVLAKKDCSKNRKARRLLGSYRLRAAVSILFKGWFSCPYCNEHSAMEVRHRHAR